MNLELFVREQIGPPPARLLEIGCGAGELALALDAAGYEVVAVDPVAPDGPIFRRMRFEELDDPGPFDAVVASSSLHHLHDLDAAFDRAAALLRPGGTIVVSEFAWDRMDEPTADWYHGQLRALGVARGHDVPASVDETRAKWEADHAGLHTGDALLAALDARFERRSYSDEPYLHGELGGPATESLERTLVETGAIRPLGFLYVGVRT